MERSRAPNLVGDPPSVSIFEDVGLELLQRWHERMGKCERARVVDGAQTTLRSGPQAIAVEAGACA